MPQTCTLTHETEIQDFLALKGVKIGEISLSSHDGAGDRRVSNVQKKRHTCERARFTTAARWGKTSVRPHKRSVVPSCSFGAVDQTAVPVAWTERAVLWKRHDQHIVQRSLSLPRSPAQQGSVRQAKQRTLETPNTGTARHNEHGNKTRARAHAHTPTTGTNASGRWMIIALVKPIITPYIQCLDRFVINHFWYQRYHFKQGRKETTNPGNIKKTEQNSPKPDV